MLTFHCPPRFSCKPLISPPYLAHLQVTQQSPCGPKAWTNKLVQQILWGVGWWGDIWKWIWETGKDDSWLSNGVHVGSFPSKRLRMFALFQPGLAKVIAGDVAQFASIGCFLETAPVSLLSPWCREGCCYDAAVVIRIPFCTSVLQLWAAAA